MAPARAEVAEHVSIDKGVVVGEDGSPPAARALLWGAEDALRRLVPLHVVRAWTSSSVRRNPDWRLGFVPTLGEMEEEVRADLARRVHRVLGRQIGLDLRLHVAHGPPAQVLIEASQVADVIVIGGTGQRRRGESTLGGTAQSCLRHAACPVVLVR